MKLSDPLYGVFDIAEPVLQELLESKSVNRLKGINQSGYYPGRTFDTRDLTRYRHSIGVFLFLRKINAPMEEQIAGLLHDISHSAFSHTIDYIKKDKSAQKTHNHQDSIHNDYVKKSDVAGILEKHGISVDYILDDRNFPLKENDLPNICADRIDYSLQTLIEVRKDLPLSFFTDMVEDIMVYNNQAVFKTYDMAKRFTDNFKWCDERIYAHLGSAVMFSISGKMLGYAIDKEYIAYDDLYKMADMEIIAKLKTIPDTILHSYFKKLERPTADYQVKTKQDRFDTAFCKVRRINPYFLDNGRLVRVSEIDKVYDKELLSTPKFVEHKIKEW